MMSQLIEKIIHDMLECYVGHQAAIYSALMDKDVTKNVKDFSYLYNVSKFFSSSQNQHD